MKLRFLFAMAALVLVPPAQAQDTSPKAFVESIYKQYLDKDSRAVDLSTREQLDKYFTPSLADLIEQDAKTAEKENEAPILNGDPFIDAQDWQVSDMVAAVKEAGAERPNATATFRNFDKTISVRLALLRTPRGWRVDDIFWTDGSLRALYKPPQ